VAAVAGCTSCGVNMTLVTGNSSNNFGGLSYCQSNQTFGYKMLAGFFMTVLLAVASIL